MVKEKIKRSLWPDLRNGFALFAISLPFTLVAILKFIYNAARSNDLFLGIGNSIATIYEKYAFLKFMWQISPSPTIETAFTFSNFMALAVLVCSVVGLGWMSRSYNNYFRLLDAERKAEDQQLIDDFKK